MIELKNVIKKYGNNIAVDDLSFKIDKGEVVGFLGPNGAGKSTTMKLISGFLLPDSGKIIIDGQNVAKDPIAAKAKIGYMPESNPLYKEMIVKDAINLAYNLHLTDKPNNQKRLKKVEEVVKATGLEKVYYRPISELSKGYKQRVGIAQVLVHDPDILILDEPTEGLDPNQRAEIRNLIKELGKDRTVIISTHVMQEVEAMCSRIIIINNGKLIKDGSKDQVVKGGVEGESVKVKIKAGSDKTNLGIKDLFKNYSPSKLSSTKEIVEYQFNVKEYDSFVSFLNKTVKEKNWEIYELSKESQNLEELFRDLTNK